MESLSVVLPDSLKSFVAARVAEGGYATVADYVSELIEADRRREAADRLEDLLLEGLNSGPTILVTEAFWEERRRKLARRTGSDEA